MRAGVPLLLMISGLLLACSHGTSSGSGGIRARGRYAGIGVFDAGRLWGQMTPAQQTGDTQAAQIADDEHVIVVTDTRTGEIRQCGDHSGYCVSMNPWSGAVPAAPVKLAKHMSDLAAEDRAASK